MGRCAPIGYCIYANDGCSLGYSYGPYAPKAIANACVSAEATSTSGTSDDSASGCIGDCDSLLVEEVGRWSLSVGISLLDAVVLEDDSIVVAGTDGPDTRVVSLASNTSVELAGLVPRGVVGSREGLYVGGNDGERPTLVALTTTLEQRWTRSWSTTREDVIVGLGASVEDGVVVGGLAWGRPWVEQLDADGQREWIRQWDPDALRGQPEALLALGGVTIVVAHDDTNALREFGFDPRGEALAGDVLVSDSAGKLLDADISPSGIAIAGPGWVVGRAHGGDPTITATVQADTVAATFDATHQLVVASQGLATPLEISVLGGGGSRRSQLMDETVDHLAVTQSADGVGWVVAQAGSEVIVWSVQP